MTTGDHGHCVRPCTDVDYIVGKDMIDFSLGDPEEVAKVGGCNRREGKGREGVIIIEFGRRFLYETVRLVLFMLCQYYFRRKYLPQEAHLIQLVDLLSGFGGAAGLWLGWSVMTLVELFITTAGALTDIMK